MLQTIDRALTIYANMNSEDHPQSTILQAAVTTEQTESSKLLKRCRDVASEACKMEAAIEKNTYPPHSKYTLDEILNYVSQQCNEMQTQFPSIITQERNPIFLSAMMYYVYGRLQYTAGTFIYQTIKKHCGDIPIPQIHGSKRPISWYKVIELVETETFSSISTDVITKKTKRLDKAKQNNEQSAPAKSKCTVS